MFIHKNNISAWIYSGRVIEQILSWYVLNNNINKAVVTNELPAL